MSTVSIKRDTSTSTSTRIQRPWLLRLAQTLWLALFCINVVIVGANHAVIWPSVGIPCEALPCAITQVQPQFAARFAEANVPFVVVAYYRPLLDLIAAVIYIGLAALIFRQRTNDWMSLLVSATLFLVGPRLSGVNVSLNQLLPATRLIGFIMLSLMYATALVSLYLFPTGRFVPRWSWAVLAVQLPLSVWSIFLQIMQGQTPPLLLAMVNGGLTLLGIGLQVYRYRAVATPIERQQSKLVIAAVAALVIGQIMREGAARLNPYLDGGAFVIVTMGGYISAYLFALGLPVAITSAVLRYRLWDADLVINRSLVYALVTLVLAAVFGTVLFVMDVAVRTIFKLEDSTWSLVAATALVVAAYNPVRRWIARNLDMHIYGFRVELDEIQRTSRQDETVILPRSEQVDGVRSGGLAGELRLENLLGRGGMGEVYLGRHLQTGQRYAVKLLPRELSNMREALERFERESHVLVGLNHPNIIKTYGAGQTHETPYYVMEYIDGRTLSDRLRTGELMSFEMALQLLHGIASALDTAHAAGIVHRDVKPSNILLRFNDGQPQPVLTDFGIAKLTDESAPVITRSTMMGTLEYVAPEQIITAREVDHRADVYSLGVVAYQMMTGATPFSGGPGRLVFSHLNKPAPDPRHLNSSLSSDAALAVLRAMNKHPERRFESASAFVRAIAPDH